MKQYSLVAYLPTMNNKKTPADFASTTALNAVNAVVAVTALAGMAANMTHTAHAADSVLASYNPVTQKSIGVNGLDMITYTTVQTGSYPGNPYSTEDSKTTTDQF